MTGSLILPRRPTRLAIAAALLLLDGFVMVLSGTAFMVLGGTRGVELHVFNEVYPLGPPLWPWLLVPLGVLELVASYLAGTQRRFWVVMGMATAAALAGLGAGVVLGGWAWFATCGLVALMIATSRRSFID